MTTSPPSQVLLVDSDADDRRSLSNLLSAGGFEVTTAVDYEAAAKSLESTSFDLAVVATRLSKGPSGFVALRAIKAKGKTFVVVLLPENNHEEAVSAFRLGAGDVLVKPPRGTELLGVLRRGVGEEVLVTSSQPVGEADMSEGVAE
jgi:DNA-binding NtrC family response regulator